MAGYISTAYTKRNFQNQNDAIMHHMYTAASSLNVGGTQWHVLSAAVHQTHIWDEHVVHNSVRCEMLLYAVEM